MPTGRSFSKTFAIRVSFRTVIGCWASFLWRRHLACPDEGRAGGFALPRLIRKPPARRRRQARNSATLATLLVGALHPIRKIGINGFSARRDYGQKRRCLGWTGREEIFHRCRPS